MSVLSADEYISRSFEHDVEYVLGTLVSRAIPTYPHSRLQSLLAAALFPYERRLCFRGVIAQRVQVAPEIFRIPDICLVRSRPKKEYVTEPPFLAVEILSPDEDMVELFQKIREYQQLGVETIWVIDPVRRTGTVFTGGTSTTVKDGIFRAGVVEVNLGELALD